MNNQLDFSKGALALLGCEDHLKNYVASLNLNPTQFNQVTGDMRWLPSDLDAIAPTLDKLIFGSANATGASKESFTAEWVAMIITALVKPFNWHDACTMMHNLSFSSDVVNNSENQQRAIEKNVTHRHLFALCTTFIGNAEHEILAKFQKSVRAKLSGKTS